jgi:hypothetical protein
VGGARGSPTMEQMFDELFIIYLQNNIDLFTNLRPGRNARVETPGNFVNMHKKEVIAHFPFVTILTSANLYRCSNTHPHAHL